MSIAAENSCVKTATIFLLVLPYVALQFWNGFYLPMMSQSAYLYWTYDLAANLLLPAIIYWQLTKRQVTPCAYGFAKPYFLYDSNTLLGQSAALFLFAGFVYFVESKVLWGLYASPNTFSYTMVMPSDSTLKLLVNVYFSATAGLVESVVYLGLMKLMLQHFVTGRAGNIIFVFASTLIFASVHWEQGVMPMFTAGCMQLIFSLAYLRIQYLPPFIAAHAAIDFVIFY